MAIRLERLAVVLGMLLASSQVLAHGHHSHGAPMTEIEQKRQRAFLIIAM